MRKANAIFESSKDDGGRKAAAMDGQVDLAKKLSANDTDKLGKEIKEARKAKMDADLETLKRLMADSRAPSKARSIGAGKATYGPGGRVKAFRQSFRDYKAGEILTAISAVKGYLSDGVDVELINAGRQRLSEFATY